MTEEMAKKIAAMREDAAEKMAATAGNTAQPDETVKEQRKEEKQPEPVADNPHGLREGERIYFSRLNGCAHTLKSGERAIFTNGIYVTDDPVKIEQLDALLKHEPNFLICGEPVPCAGLDPNPDVILPKDITNRGNATAVLPQNFTQRGMGNSQSAARLAASAGQGRK